MKPRILFFILILSSLISGCTLDTSGTLELEVWIDAPENNTNLLVSSPVAIMAHSNTQSDRMILLINGTPLLEMSVVQVSENLWEGTTLWTPVATGRYNLRVRSTGSIGQTDSGEIRVNVLETHSYPMTYLTPTPTSTPSLAATPTAWPAPQINFQADQLSILRGNCTSLHWEVNYATSVFLNGEAVPQLGSRQICPTNTTVYTLKVEAPGGTVEPQLTIVVIQPPTATSTHRPPTAAPPSITPVPDTTPPEIKKLSHTPDAIWDMEACGATAATISVRVSDPSGVAKVELFYRVVSSSKKGAWRSTPMSHTGGTNYSAVLDGAKLQSSLSSYGGGMVEYYVKAWDASDNLAQSGSNSFEVKICLI